MASPLEIEQLRLLINDTVEPYEFSNDQLNAQLDAAAGDQRKAASAVWGIKAATLAGLVDVTEGSSSRKLGALHKQAIEMSIFYGGDPATSSRGSSRTRAIVRPT